MAFKRVKPFRTKPAAVYEKEFERKEMPAQYGFWSLMAIGIGGSVGSGIFVSSGKIARNIAGPAGAISWLISGLVCAVTALAYAELAAILKSPGSAYSFSYFGLGEVFAVLSAFLVSLEYGMSGAAVARSWGDKLAYWFVENGWGGCTKECCWVNSVGGSPFNPAALLVSALTLLLILAGVKLEKIAVDVLVFIKVCIVVFVLIYGATFADSANLSPFLPEPGMGPHGEPLPDFQGGVGAIVVGATTAFFGFIGFDEVTCMSPEAKNPARDVPRATLLTIAILTLLYTSASLILTAMVPYSEIDPDEGFGSAFQLVGAGWVTQLILIGEIFIIFPTVILVSYMPQARLLYAVARDGLFPQIFAKVSKRTGHLFWGAFISGIVFTLIAAFVPFDYLNDLISGGILLSFIFTNMSLMLSRSKGEGKLPIFVIAICAGVAALLLCKASLDSAAVLVVLAILIFVYLGALGYAAIKIDFTPKYEDTFQAPFVPVLPSLAIFANWYLIGQLEWLGIGLVFALCGLGVFIYVFFGINHVVDYSNVESTKDSEEKDAKIDFLPSGPEQVA